MKYNKNNKPLVCMQTNSTCYKKTRKMRIVGILWHSTGANNPNLKRYIQPLKTDSNYSQLIKQIGTNYNKNDYNHMSYQSGLNAWIGKLENGSVSAVQSMPWDFRPWGCGSGQKGSCNNGWIQFEICEDNLNDPVYFNQVYKEACELTAYLCELYNIDPNGTVKVNGVKIPTILCHADSNKLGFGSSHGDVLHWFPKFGKSMATVRADVATLLKNQNLSEEEDEDMTQEKFNQMMDVWMSEQARKSPGAWSKNARDWAESEKIISGDSTGRMMYKKPITREELIQVLYRSLKDIL